MCRLFLGPQTAAVASFILQVPMLGVYPFIAAGLLFIFPINIFVALYTVYFFFFDKAPYTGEKMSPWLRGLRYKMSWRQWTHNCLPRHSDLPGGACRWWTYYREFFPLKLVKTAELPSDRKYIFGVHPHGFFSFGAFGVFATDGCGFAKLFPGIRAHLVTLKINFFIPFVREIWLRLGIVTSDRETFRNILSEKGRAMAVVVGGAAESLKMSPGTMDLVLAKRKGFVRQAFLNGASLVPVLTFGENDLYGIAKYKWMEKIQHKLQKLFGFALPLIHGRGDC